MNISSIENMNISDDNQLPPEVYKEFIKIMNRRRPYCSKDSIPQTFIADLD